MKAGFIVCRWVSEVGAKWEPEEVPKKVVFFPLLRLTLAFYPSMISYYPYILLSLTLTPPQSLQDAVDILDDYYCTDNVTGDPYVDFNCTAYFDAQYQHGGTNLTRRDLVFGTNAVSVPQIYRWRRGSVITISVARNNKGVYMDLNAGIAFAPPYWITVRSSQISASAISKAIKYWNAAQIGVQFKFSTDLTKSDLRHQNWWN